MDVKVELIITSLALYMNDFRSFKHKMEKKYTPEFILY